jgi:hypothetical protein
MSEYLKQIDTHVFDNYFASLNFYSSEFVEIFYVIMTQVPLLLFIRIKEVTLHSQVMLRTGFSMTDSGIWPTYAFSPS